MWYFGTHGDLGMTGPKPENGPDGLKKYDPDAFARWHAFYSGRIQVGKESVAAETDATDVNLAIVATPSASYVPGDTSVAAR